jgi:Ca2+-binding EF-hand superfamily protein
MRSCWFAVLMTLVIALSANAQGKFGGQGGGGKGNGPGGAAPGGFGGGGGFGGAPRDPNQIFDYLAKGRTFFLLTDTRSLREPLTKYAQENGITDGKITREHFSKFNEQMKTQSGGAAGGGNMFMRKGPPGAEGTSPTPGGPPGATPGMSQEEALSKWAEAEFKNRDRNGDGKLNADEMGDRLKDQLARFDVNKDGLIDLAEFRGYMAARMDRREDGEKAPANPVVILVEEDLDRRPTVFRAGRLPKELPKWFADLDTDGDGQIALFEWRVSKSVEEFAEYDRNDDGLITPEEVLRKLNITSTEVAASGSGSGSPMVIRGSGGEDRRAGFMGGGKDGGGGGGFGNFFRKKGKN